MALKPCTGCGRRIDTTARKCPGCGRLLPTTPNALKGFAAAILVAFAVLFATALFQVVKTLAKAGAHPTGISTSSHIPDEKTSPGEQRQENGDNRGVKDIFVESPKQESDRAAASKTHEGER